MYPVTQHFPMKPKSKCQGERAGRGRLSTLLGDICSLVGLFGDSRPPECSQDSDTPITNGDSGRATLGWQEQGANDAWNEAWASSGQGAADWFCKQRGRGWSSPAGKKGQRAVVKVYVWACLAPSGH